LHGDHSTGPDLRGIVRNDMSIFELQQQNNDMQEQFTITKHRIINKTEGNKKLDQRIQKLTKENVDPRMQ